MSKEQASVNRSWVTEKFKQLSYEIQFRMHAEEAKNAGWCKRCRFPWMELRCTCGHVDSPEVKYILELIEKEEKEMSEKENKKAKGKMSKVQLKEKRDFKEVISGLAAMTKREVDKAMEKTEDLSIWGIKDFKEMSPESQFAVHAKKAKDFGWCAFCQEPWEGKGECKCGHSGSPEVMYIYKLWQEEMKKKMLEAKEAMKGKHCLWGNERFEKMSPEAQFAVHTKKAKDSCWCYYCQYPWLGGTCCCGNGSSPEVKHILELKKEEAKLVEKKQKKKEEAEKMGKKLCQQCLNPDQKGVCHCENGKTEKISKCVKPKVGAYVHEVPVQPFPVVGVTRKPELLELSFHRNSSGVFFAIVTGNLMNDSIRFANEHGTFIVKRGSETSWKSTGKKSGTLIVADSPSANHGKTFKVQGCANVDLLKKAIEAYNGWIRPQMKRFTSLAPEICNVVDEMAEALEKSEKSEVPAFSIDSFIGKLKKDGEHRRSCLYGTIAGDLEEMALKIRMEGARQEMMEKVIEMLHREQQKEAKPEAPAFSL